MNARSALNINDRISKIDPRIYGSFIEHLYRRPMVLSGNIPGVKLSANSI